MSSRSSRGGLTRRGSVGGAVDVIERALAERGEADEASRLDSKGAGRLRPPHDAAARGEGRARDLPAWTGDSSALRGRRWQSRRHGGRYWRVEPAEESDGQLEAKLSAPLHGREWDTRAGLAVGCWSRPSPSARRGVDHDDAGGCTAQVRSVDSWPPTPRWACQVARSGGVAGAPVRRRASRCRSYRKRLRPGARVAEPSWRMLPSRPGEYDERSG